MPDLEPTLPDSSEPRSGLEPCLSDGVDEELDEAYAIATTKHPQILLRVTELYSLMYRNKRSLLLVILNKLSHTYFIPEPHQFIQFKREFEPIYSDVFGGYPASVVGQYVKSVKVTLCGVEIPWEPDLRLVKYPDGTMEIR